MIEIIGAKGTPEYEAATAIAASLETTWRGISESNADEDLVRIVASAKLSGYQVSDIDVIIAARFNKKRYIAPRTVFLDRDGERITGAKVRISSFLAAVEVKDHGEDGVKCEAGSVSVKYRGEWKNATDQNDKQKYALRDYFINQGAKNPWVYRCVMLRGISALPQHRGRTQPEAGAIAADFTAMSFLMAMASVNGVRKSPKGEYEIRSDHAESMERVLGSPLFRALKPTNLDRKRMDRLIAKSDTVRELAPLMGKSRIHLRGNGGTGKTVLLLQSAAEAFQQHGKRILILTYNHALASDIQRLMALAGIPADSEGGGIEVRTVMSFMQAWFRQLGVAEPNDDISLESYLTRCEKTLEYLEGDVVTAVDLKRAKSNDWESFGFDAILVDEAQDWPQPEADLLCAFYGENAISIADGVGQLVRGRPTKWALPSGKPLESIRSLKECRRMKANLARFANAMAEEAGLKWSVTPSSEAGGGRVIVHLGDYGSASNLRSEILSSAREAGNEEVDFLHCVPASEVLMSGNARSSALSGVLRSEGHETWDGVDANIRRDFPRSVREFRIVQYESCRGLEGWVTVLDGFDEFWERKRDEVLHSGNHDELPKMQSADAYACAAAWQWAMIALTRPIDTLVITLRRNVSEAGEAVLKVARQHPDIVELYE